MRKIKSLMKKIIPMRGDNRNTIPLPGNAVYSPLTDIFLRIREIPGWFTLDDCAHFAMALGMQRAFGIKGDILEIGCYHGRSTAVLGSFLDKGERLHVCDIFEGGDKDVYGECPTPETVVANIQKVTPGLKSEALKVIKGDSSKLRLFPGDRFRFVHVDGGHSYKVCLSDLRVCVDHVVDGGIIVVDDYMHPDWQEVTSAVDDFMAQRKDLQVVADLNRAHAIGRKLYLMRRP